MPAPKPGDHLVATGIPLDGGQLVVAVHDDGSATGYRAFDGETATVMAESLPDDGRAQVVCSGLEPCDHGIPGGFHATQVEARRGNARVGYTPTYASRFDDIDWGRAARA